MTPHEVALKCAEIAEEADCDHADEYEHCKTVKRTGNAIRAYAATLPDAAGERDAARYRWLRREQDLVDDAPFICRRDNSHAFSRWTGEDADAVM